MAGKLVFRVGVSMEEIDREIVENCEAALVAAEHGETFEPRRTVSFENWTTFFRSMTPNRIAVLEHVAAHDVMASTRALAAALGRDYAAVHADVSALVKLGLLERHGTSLRCEAEPGKAELAAA